MLRRLGSTRHCHVPRPQVIFAFVSLRDNIHMVSINTNRGGMTYHVEAKAFVATLLCKPVDVDFSCQAQALAFAIVPTQSSEHLPVYVNCKTICDERLNYKTQKLKKTKREGRDDVTVAARKTPPKSACSEHNQTRAPLEAIQQMTSGEVLSRICFLRFPGQTRA